ncbi:hypothetical protein Thal_0422 [Thermocrinis albus DSM 14484]|uniref:ThiamineS protein n=1 Tax=Thermocrinis albus (strain DSM 14484 / JCM 11386 / HI 11/12) TaxID=638303 RepID=D3SPH0_THEAH|nr:MoaD/ThiS family protein [Thermocrinis albus]ADC89057.1 hypothetical protein Thal_0422 [Thermocrinis albus DSM 14484]
MKVKLLGYLAYRVGHDTVEVYGVRSVRELIRSLAKFYGMEEVFFKDGDVWEGVLIIVNGKLVGIDFEDLKEEDEIVLSLPTAGG